MRIIGTDKKTTGALGYGRSWCDSARSLVLLPLVRRYLLELAFSSAGHSVSPYGPDRYSLVYQKARFAYKDAPASMHANRGTVNP